MELSLASGELSVNIVNHYQLTEEEVRQYALIWFRLFEYTPSEIEEMIDRYEETSTSIRTGFQTMSGSKLSNGNGHQFDELSQVRVQV
ncbi:MAG: hypothetical protein ACRC8A_13245 [Microcoleaceae cyanobacterium]